MIDDRLQLSNGYTFAATNPLTGELDVFVVTSVTIQGGAIHADVEDRASAQRRLLYSMDDEDRAVNER